MIHLTVEGYGYITETTKEEINKSPGLEAVRQEVRMRGKF
jgi:hypothetical protein